VTALQEKVTVLQEKVTTLHRLPDEGSG